MEVDSRMAMQLSRQMPYKGTKNMYNQKGYKRKLTKEEMRRLRCTHCQENGHEVRECFKLHGYPDWYKKLKENMDGERVNYLEDDGDIRSKGGGRSG